MLKLSPSEEMSKISALAEEFCANILYDEEPLFVSDEAMLWGVWMGDVDEVLERCRNYYGVPITMEETQQPLWKLLPLLDERRKAAKSLSSCP
jgi:Zn-dependent peptidase ImmA (M78 family)